METERIVYRPLQTRFAPVAPIQILEDLHRQDEFGDYHLFLAHHTNEERSRFSSLMTRVMQSKPYSHRHVTVIMDNSVVELGGAVDDDMIKYAVLALNPGPRLSVVPVLPDVMGSGKETITLSEAAYQRWVRPTDKTRRTLQADSWMPGDGYMLVTQGANWQDFVNLVNYFFVEFSEDFKHITWVGIPRKLIAEGIPRTIAAQYIKMVAPHVKIHLLGFSENIEADLMAARSGGICGIDSAVPLRYNGILLPQTVALPRDKDWFKNGVLTQKQRENLRNVRKWVGGH